MIGHTRCGAVSAAVKLLGSPMTAAEATGCEHLDSIVSEIHRSAEGVLYHGTDATRSPEMASQVDAVARQNVLRVVKEIRAQSKTLDGLVQKRRIAIVGAMYDVVTGGIEFVVEDGLRETESQNTA